MFEARRLNVIPPRASWQLWARSLKLALLPLSRGAAMFAEGDRGVVGRGRQCRNKREGGDGEERDEGGGQEFRAHGAEITPAGDGANHGSVLLVDDGSV